MTAWDGATIAMVAIGVGALVMVLFQLFATLGSTRKLLDGIRPSLAKTMKEVSEISARVNSLTETVEENRESVAKMMKALGRLSESIDRLRSIMDVAGAVGAAAGPAVVSAIRAVRGSPGVAPEAPPPEENTSAENDAPDEGTPAPAAGEAVEQSQPKGPREE